MSSPGRAAHRAVLCLFILSPQLNPRPRAFLVTVSRQQQGGEEPPAFSLSTPGNNKPFTPVCFQSAQERQKCLGQIPQTRPLGELGEPCSALTTPTLLFIHYSCKSVCFFPSFLCLSVLSQTLCWPNWTARCHWYSVISKGIKKRDV